MGKIVTPSSLKWLIDKRARLLGEINKLTTSLPERLIRAREDVEQAELKLAQAKELLAYEETVRNQIIPTLQKDLNAIDTVMKLHAIKINPEIIQPIYPQNSKRVLPYGRITKCVFDCLKRAEDNPLSTLDIAMFVASRNGLEMSGEKFQKFREVVRHRLKNMCNEGKIERANPMGGSIKVKWILSKTLRN